MTRGTTQFAGFADPSARFYQTSGTNAACAEALNLESGGNVLSSFQPLQFQHSGSEVIGRYALSPVLS